MEPKAPDKKPAPKKKQALAQKGKSKRKPAPKTPATPPLSDAEVREIVKARKRTRKPKKKGDGKPGRKAWEPNFEMVEKYAMLGMYDKEIAALCGVHHTVFCERKNELPELVAALERGRAKATQVATVKVWEHINKGDKEMIKFFLSRRAGWVEKVDVSFDPQDLSTMTTEELLARREELLARRKG